MLFFLTKPSCVFFLNNNMKVHVCVHVCISVCASQCVCIFFMARNQLSLAHNGNVNSPKQLSPTQGEIWLEAGSIFPNHNSERELAGLKSCPLLSFTLELFTALPIHYLGRSSKQVSLPVGKAYPQTHTCARTEHTHLQVQLKGEVVHIVTNHIVSAP